MSADTFEVGGVSLTRFLGTDTGVPKINKEVGVHYESYQRLVGLTLRALEKVSEGMIPDPTVGENACQLRSGFYTEIYNAADFSTMIEQTKATLLDVKSKFSERKFVFKHPTVISGTILREKVSVPKGSVDHFLDSVGVSVTVDPRVMMIVAGFFLEMARPATYAFALEGGRVVINQHVQKDGSDELKQLGYKSKVSVHNFSEMFKVALSKFSVQEAQRCASAVVPEEESERLLRMVSGDRVKVTAQGLYTVPCFSSSEALLHRAHQLGTPLVVRIHRVDAMTAAVSGVVDFFFKSEEGNYVPGFSADLVTKRSAIFCEAVSAVHPALTEEEVRAEMATRDITEVILAFMATHPVYGGSLNGMKGHDEERAVRKPLKAKAMEIGCCMKNQKFCRLFHMMAVPTAKFTNEENNG